MIGGTEGERMRRKISKRNRRYHSEAVEKPLRITKWVVKFVSKAGRDRR
jgi:hypothetical protein